MIETHYQLNTPFSIALLSDLHGRPFSNVERSLRRNLPEVICICGDFIYGKRPEDGRSPLEEQENVLPFIAMCANIAPTYVSLGNHEWLLDEKDIDDIEKTGVRVLDNDWIVRGGAVIGGLTSATATDYRRFRNCCSSDERYPSRRIGRHRRPAAQLTETGWITEMPQGYRILLSHHPEYWDRVKDTGIDLMLSGHTHNGQFAYYSIRKHRWTGLWAPGQGWFPKYSSGVYEDGKLIVSAGLSNTAPVPRLFNPTQIIYIE